MNTKPTQEEIAKLCENYIDKRGHSAFVCQFRPQKMRKVNCANADFEFDVHCYGLGVINYPHSRVIVEAMDKFQEAAANEQLMNALNELQSV